MAPNRSRLEHDLIESVHAEVMAQFAGHVAEVWEWLARDSLARLRLHGIDWNPASRWWGRDAAGVPLEIDVVAESADRRNLLFGEVKWTERSAPARIHAELVQKAERAPFRDGRQVHYALWLKTPDVEHVDGTPVIGPAAVMAPPR